MQKLLLPENRSLEDSVSTALFPILLCSAAAQGDLHSLEAMLQLTDASVRDYDGRTALHLAAKAAQMNCVTFLVEQARAPINAVDTDHHTPLDLTEDAAVRAYLEKHGAKTGTQLRSDHYRRQSQEHLAPGSARSI